MAISYSKRMRRRLRWSLARLALRWWMRPYIRRLNKPIIAITGTNGKTTVATLLDRVLRQSGSKVGLATTYEVRQDGQLVAEGDYAWGYGIWLAARGGDMDVLVAETARGGMVDNRFGFDECQVAIITNVSEDHLGIGGIETVDQMAELKSRLLERLAPNGTAVLNADDPRVREMGRSVPNAIYFSSKPLPPEFIHCYFVSDGQIWRRVDGDMSPIVSLSDVALYNNGLLPYNLLNAMAVLSALDGVSDVLAVDRSAIIDVFRSFGTSADDHPYSFTLLEPDGQQVLLTSSKNPAGFAEHVESIRSLSATRGYRKVVGFITHVGDRPKGFYANCAARASQVCDQLFVMPPKPLYRRGRSPEKIMDFLAAGVPSSKLRRYPNSKILEIANEMNPERSRDTLFVIFNSTMHHALNAQKILGEEKRISLAGSGSECRLVGAKS